VEGTDDVHVSEIVKVRFCGIPTEMNDAFAALERRDHAFEVRQVELMTDFVAQERRYRANVKAVHRLDVIVQTSSQNRSDSTGCTGDSPHWLHRNHPPQLSEPFG
jgi:hypothetical protein